MATVNKNQQRWIGQMPKIGIRPAIDGRRKGVRESLEVQTVRMAAMTADFLSANLRYPDGNPVQCVIADTCIGGVAEAAQCADKFAREVMGTTVTLSASARYGKGLAAVSRLLQVSQPLDTLDTADLIFCLGLDAKYAQSLSFDKVSSKRFAIRRPSSNCFADGT